MTSNRPYAENAQNQDRKTVIIQGDKQLDRIITRITYQILDNHNGADNIAFVGLKTRGKIIAQRIIEKIKEIENVEVPLGTVDTTLYRDDFIHKPEMPLSRYTQLPFDVDSVTIILIDDMLGTGRTIRAAIDCIIDFGRPINIEVAVLCDRKVVEFPIVAKYVGRETYVDPDERLVISLKERDGEDKIFVCPRQ